MDKRRLDELLAHLETHLECWRQFNGFVMKGKDGDFDATDEAEFLEIKSSLVQQLEVIRNYIEEGGPNRDAIHLLIGSAPSIAAVGQMGDTGQRSLESNWHQIFVAWQTVLGQIKAQAPPFQRQTARARKVRCSNFACGACLRNGLLNGLQVLIARQQCRQQINSGTFTNTFIPTGLNGAVVTLCG